MLQCSGTNGLSKKNYGVSQLIVAVHVEHHSYGPRMGLDGGTRRLLSSRTNCQS